MQYFWRWWKLSCCYVFVSPQACSLHIHTLSFCSRVVNKIHIINIVCWLKIKVQCICMLYIVQIYKNNPLNFFKPQSAWSLIHLWYKFLLTLFYICPMYARLIRSTCEQHAINLFMSTCHIYLCWLASLLILCQHAR